MSRLIAAIAALTIAGTASADVRIGASDAAEFPVETAALVAATEAFFASVEAEPATPSPSGIRIEGDTAVQISFDLGDDATASLTRPHGPVDRLTGYRINFYPLDRFVGAVDFMGLYDEANLVCGYLIWDLTDPNTPVLDDVVAAYLDTDSLRSMGDHEAHQHLLEANCAYGELAPNLTLLQ